MIFTKKLSLILFLAVFTISFSNEVQDNEVLNEDIPIVEGFGTVTIPEEDDVLILDKDNFDHVISTKTLILVEFYAPWCGHCRALAPQYAAAATELLTDNIRLAKVDTTIETDLAKRYDISGYPTLKLFKKGHEEPIDFEGARSTAGIVEFMRQHADPNYKPPPSAVVELTDSTFAEFVESNEISLVEFYAPWCGHCKQLAPEYEEAARVLEGDIPLVKVEATKEPELAKKYGVTGYPTIFIFRKNRHFQYNGPRDRNGIVRYMREQAESPSKEVKSTIHVKNHARRTEPYIFAFFEQKNDFYKEYVASGNELRDTYIFLHTFDSDLAEKYKLPPNSLNVFFPEIYFSKFEKRHQILSESTSSQEEISKWITDHSIPLVGQRTKSNMDHLYTQRPLLIVYYDVNFSHQYIKDTQYIRSKILPIAKKHSDITFAIASEEEYQDEMKEFGLDDSGESVNVAILGDSNSKYPMEPEDDFDGGDLEEFIQKFKKGKLKPYLKSQPIPKRQDGLVRVIVAKTFEKELLQNKKNVLIEFYAPWCGHCKQLEPVYKKLAKHYKDDNTIIIAKMDATANDVHPLFETKGFPTIYYLVGSDKTSPILFNGERSLDGFKTFIEEHSPSSARDEL